MKYSIIIASFTYTVLLSYLSLRPIPPELGDIFSYQDKFMHLGAYLILGALYLKSSKAVLIPMILAVLVGVSLEFFQSLTSYRSFELLDMVANAVGVLISYPIVKSKLFR